MIRIGIPPTAFPRLRVRWIEAHTFAVRLRRRGGDGVLAWSEALTATGGRLRTASADRLGLRRRAVARKAALLAEFFERYETLLDLLCRAANEGVSPEREERYASMRKWMLATYPHVGSSLRIYWHNPAIDDNVDPFAAIFAPTLLFDVIHAPDSLDWVMRSRNALETYLDETNETGEALSVKR